MAVQQQRGPSSFPEAMTKVLSDIAAASVLPDADPKFCAMLQQAIVTKVRGPQGMAPSAGRVGAGGLGGPGGPTAPGPPPSPVGGLPGGGPGGSPANPGMPTLGAPTGLGAPTPPSMGGAPTPGLSPNADNADEVRRLMMGATA